VWTFKTIADKDKKYRVYLKEKAHLQAGWTFWAVAEYGKE